MSSQSQDGPPLRPATTVVTAGRPAHEPDNPLNTPVTMASTYVAGGEVEYGRYGNPTWSAFEEALGALEHGRALAFSSGLAAVATILDLVVVFLFTHPLLQSLARTRFFGKGHPLSGLDPAMLGRSVPAYAGRGRVRTGAEKRPRGRGTGSRALAEEPRLTLAERKAQRSRQSTGEENR